MLIMDQDQPNKTRHFDTLTLVEEVIEQKRLELDVLLVGFRNISQED